MLAAPNVTYRSVPNAKKAPELYTKAKREHYLIFDKYMGPVAPGFTLTSDHKFMYSFQGDVMRCRVVTMAWDARRAPRCDASRGADWCRSGEMRICLRRARDPDVRMNV